MATELASAYLTLIPSLKGATKTIAAQLGDVDVKGAGAKMGKSLGDSMATAFDDTAVKKMQNSVSAASEGWSRIGGSISNAGSSLMDIGGKLTQSVTLPMAAAVAAVGGFALSTASAAETTEISFTTMLGSEEAALQMMEQLADFAASTPFELSGLQTATRQLLAYGFTADEVVPMLTAVGDATAALGTGQAGIEAVTRALGQMQTRGKASAEEMLQLTEAGIPAWEYLARAIGTDTAGAMEAVSAGAVDADTAIAALTKGMEEDFGGMMESQSKTVAGLMSNLADAIQQPLMELRNSDAYDAFADALEKVVDAAGPLVESMLPLMEDGLSGLAGLMDNAAAAMEQFASMSTESKKELLQTAAAAAAAGPALTVLGGGLRVVGGAAQGIGGILGGLSTALGKAAGGAGGLTGALGLLKGGLAGLAIGVVAAGVAAFASQMLKAKEHSALFNDATKSTSDILAGVSSSMGDASADVDGLLKSLQAVNDEASTTLQDLGVQSSMLDEYVGTIEELAGKSNLTAYEQEKLAQAVDGYNQITGDTVEIIDGVNGQLSTSTDEIRKNADAWRENAEAQAYSKIAQGYIEERIKAEDELQTALEEQTAAQEKLNEAKQLDPWTDPSASAKLGAAQTEYDNATQKVDELTGALESATQKEEEFGNMAAVSASTLSTELKTAVEGLEPTLQDEGLNMATALSAGIEAGTVTVDAAASFISSSVENAISSLSVGAQEQGMAVATTLADGISAGSVTADDAARFLADGVKGVVATLPESMQTSGASVANTLAAGISSGTINVDTATQFMTQGVTGVVAQLPPEMQSKGMEAANALASAISNGSLSVDQAVQVLNAAATGTISQLPPNLQGYGAQAAQMLGVGLGDTGPTSSSADALKNAAQSPLLPLPGELYDAGTASGVGFGTGVGAGVGPTSSSSHAVANATTAMKNNNYSASGWGSELVSNFASGISSMIGAVASAASSVASTVAGFLHFSEPDEGPLVGINDSGAEMVRNYAASMRSELPTIRAAAYDVAEAARPDLESSVWGAYSSAISSGRAAQTAPTTVNNYSLNVDGMSAGGKGRIEQLMMEIFAVMLREGVM